MFDLIGSGCIMGAGFWLLWRRKAENRRRSETLTDLITALRNMAEGVRLARVPLPELLDRITVESGRDTLRFFREISAALREGKEVSEVWKCAARELPIHPCEQAAVSAIADSLRNDEEGVYRGTELAIHTLTAHKERWDMHRAEEERRIAAMYVSGAMLLVILLI